MRLEDIGFYTLSDSRAMTSSYKSPLVRCELLITSVCNFKCPYCRGTDATANITLDNAKQIVDLWCSDSLQNIRFSGGEPTTVPWLIEIIKHTKKAGVERIAISTNGSAPSGLYLDLIDSGCNDFSISLDACCSSFGDKMAGVAGHWNTVIENIKILSRLTYVTVGCVFNENNIGQSLKTIKFADTLGVSDIRILTAAQYNKSLDFVKQIPVGIVEKYPILKYRVNAFLSGRNVRGLQETDNHKCPLVLDDIAAKGGYHYPCIIYMREMGAPIGIISNSMRSDRKKWYENHDCFNDPICNKNCLDVCIDYNNKFKSCR